jgi:hypothetical protein
MSIFVEATTVGGQRYNRNKMEDVPSIVES